MLDLLAKDHFTDALPDEEMRFRIRRNKTATMRDALYMAVEMEACALASRLQHPSIGFIKGAQMDNAMEEATLVARQTTVEDSTVNYWRLASNCKHRIDAHYEDHRNRERETCPV